MNNTSMADKAWSEIVHMRDDIPDVAKLPRFLTGSGYGYDEEGDVTAQQPVATKPRSKYAMLSRRPVKPKQGDLF